MDLFAYSPVEKKKEPKGIQQIAKLRGCQLPNNCALLFLWPTNAIARSLDILYIHTSKTAVERGRGKEPAPLCSTNMMKLSCVLLVSSLLVATLAAASSSSPPYSVGKHPGWLLVLGRKGRELGQSSGYHYQHQSKQPEVSSYSLSYISPRTCSTFIPLSAHQRLKNHEPEGQAQSSSLVPACLQSSHRDIGCIFLWVQLTCSATCTQRT